MTDADKHLSGSGPTPIPWSEFARTVSGNKEMHFKAIEQRRFPDGPIVPGPSNDLITGAAILIWSSSTVSAFRHAGWADCPAETSGRALCALYDALPKGAHLDK
jgi:hypothetical protein